MDTNFGTTLVDLVRDQPDLVQGRWKHLRVPDYVGKRRGQVYSKTVSDVLQLWAGEFVVKFSYRNVCPMLRGGSVWVSVTLEEEKVPKDEEKLYDLLWADVELYGMGKGIIRRNREIILMAWKHLVLISNTVPEIEDIDAIYDFDA
jgi:hypothetical protein